MQTGQTDLRVKSAKLNFYSKHGKKMKSAAICNKNTADDKSGLHTGKRTSGNTGADRLQRADDYEPNMSLLKSEETNILENIAVNFEILNNSLSKSLTPCLSNRNPNARVASRPADGQAQAVLSRTVGLATPHRAYDRDAFGDHAEMQFYQSQPIGRSNVFNLRNANRNFRSKNEILSRTKTRTNFNSTNPSSGTLSSPKGPALLSLQPASKSGYFKLGTTSGRQSSSRQQRFLMDMSEHMANCKQIRKNFVENGIMDYDVNQISNLNFENQISQKNLQLNVSFNLQKSLSQVRQLIKRRQQSAKPGSNIQHMNLTNQYYEEIKRISKDLDLSQGVINTDQLRQMNDYIDTVYQQEQQLINSEGRRNYLMRNGKDGGK